MRLAPLALVLLAAAAGTGPARAAVAFHRFTSASFDIEGLKVTAGGGTLFTTLRQGDVGRITVAAEPLAWQYAHPVEKDRVFFEIHRKHHGKELSFVPDFLDLTCDPATCEQMLGSFSGLSAAAEEQADGRLVRLRHKRLEEEERSRREGDDSEPVPLYEPGHRYLAISVFHQNPWQEARLVRDSHEAKEITMSISGWGSWSHYGAATRASGASPEQLEMRKDASRRDYDLQSLKGTLSLGLGEKELLDGEVTVRLEARRDLRWIPLALDGLGEPWSRRKAARGPRLSVSSVRDGAGRDLVWTRTGPVSGLIELAEPVPAGQPLELTVRYQSRDALKKISGSTTYVDRDGWLPFLTYGDMVSPFDLFVKVPAKYETLCVGRKTSESRHGETNVAHCVAETPVVLPTVTYGQYNGYPSEVKAKKKTGEEIAVQVFFDRDTAALMPSLRGARAAADQAANALNLYREVFGVDYPFSKLDIVNAPEGFSGQSPDSIVYLGDPTFLSEGMLGLIFGAGVTKFRSGLVPHEVAHQWWGTQVSPANDASYWFVESLAEYASALFLEATRGREGYLERVEDWRLETLAEEGWQSVEEGAGIDTRGAYLFHMMRSIWGDEAFFGFLRKLAGDLRGREVTTRDIQKVAEAAFGQELGWFFDQWIRGAGVPEYTFTWRVTGTEGAQVLEGKVEQRVMVTTKPRTREVLPGVHFKGLGVVTMVGRSGRIYTKKLILDGPVATFRETLPEKPKEIVFNRNGEMLAYDVIAKEER